MKAFRTASSSALLAFVLSTASSAECFLLLLPATSHRRAAAHPRSTADTKTTRLFYKNYSAIIALENAKKCQAELLREGGGGMGIGGAFPRTKLAHLETPLEYCPRLSDALGGVQIYVKRDDCTGLGTGGNKARKLEWLMGEALQQKADIVMTQGATQSNHARQTAAAAARLGVGCHVLLEDRTGRTDVDYNENGNVLLDDLFGATREARGPGLDMNAEMEAVAEKYRAMGHNVYSIVGGGSNEVGALGYVNCAYEMIQQFAEQDLDVDCICHATGSAGTQAGLLTGLGAVESHIELLGFGVRASKEQQEENVYDLATRTAIKIGREGVVGRDDVVVDSGYVGPGYGAPDEGTVEAIRMFARLEGLLLDPVYTGKGAAGLIDYCRTGRFEKGDKVVFLHTGGSAALHGYPKAFKQ